MTIDALKSTLVEVEDKLRRNDVELDILGIP